MIAHSDAATARPRDAVETTVVETADGKVRGEVFRGISIFRGIPYGAPTSDANRFLPPQPPQSWSGVRNCVLYGETAPQAPGWLAEGGTPDNRPQMGEDCLVLNIWTPQTGTGNRPVMVWLHGGGFEAGSGSSMLYNGTNLAQRGDVVAVSINHRLGLLGHCHLADVGGADFNGAANAGYLDIVAALKWVRDNIGLFGGNPSNVTVYGQSGGGRKVSLLTASATAKGLLHRGIVQSGSHLRLMSRAHANEQTEQLLKHFGLAKTDTRKLQEIPLRDLMRANRDVGRATRRRFSPTLDGATFDAHPWDPEAPAAAFDIPMMIGTCRTELSNQLGTADESNFTLDDAGLAERLTRFVPADDVAGLIALFREQNPGAGAPELFFKITTARGYWLDALLQTERKAQQGGAPVWSYRLMWRTPVEGGRRITPHSLDLPFMFDNVTKAPHMVGAPTKETAAMAAMMSETWLAFARTGNPNNPAIPDWRHYDDRRTVMLFDVPPAAQADPHAAERQAIEKYPTQQLGGVLHR